jgi:phytoene/squalene synthetase
MDDAVDTADFAAKWTARWPEWAIARTFVPPAEHADAEAWFALLQEWAEAAWAGEEPTPGLAKLAWWEEELRGWTRGLRRHPLGRDLQRRSAPWGPLADALAGLRETREAVRAGGDPEVIAARMEGFAIACGACETALFTGDGAHAARLLAVWPEAPAATRARRVHDALVRARLAAGADRLRAPLSPLKVLWTAWRAARHRSD